MDSHHPVMEELFLKSPQIVPLRLREVKRLPRSPSQYVIELGSGPRACTLTSVPPALIGA